MPLGPPSNRNDTGTCSTSEICCRRLAPTRLVPFSYFWICWKVRPSASPSFSWLMPSMIRRIRTRLPTYLSTGFGALVDISDSPWDQASVPVLTLLRTRDLHSPLNDKIGRTPAKYDQRALGIDIRSGPQD